MARGLRFFFDRLFRRARLDREMEEEIRAHLELRAADLEKSGLCSEKARRHARLEFGGVEGYKERSRETRRFHRLHDLLADIRYGLRLLRKTPGFTAVAVVTLALGIGANTAIFSAVEAVLLRPLPYPDPDRIVFLAGASLNTSNFSDWKRQATSYEQLAAFAVGSAKMTGGEEPQAVRSLMVSEDFVALLGTALPLGRPFAAADFRPENPRVGIVSDHVWRTQFGSSRTVLGQTLVLDGSPYTLIGVLPADPGPLPYSDVDLWLPLIPARPQGTAALGRLKPGVTLAQARAEAMTIAARFHVDAKARGARSLIRLDTLKEQLVGSNDSRITLLVLAGAVGFILLIACANVANLFLVRTAGRQRELGIRTALGATRGRVLRQLLTESLLLALFGAALGIVLAHWGIRFLLLLIPYWIPRIEQSHIDGGVLAFTALLTLLTAIACGIAPATSAARLELATSFKDGARESGRGKGHHRIRRLLVIGEVAIALVMLTGAGLLIKTFLVLCPSNPGFNPDHKLTMTLSMSGRFRDELPREREFLRDVILRIRAVPGVTGVAAVTNLPFSGMTWVPDVWIDGKPVGGRGRGNLVHFRLSTSNYFRLMQMPVTDGRDFSDTDDERTPKVAIINQAMARRYWPGLNPVGRRIVLDTGGNNPDELTIIGIVRDARIDGTSTAPEAEVYAPMWQIRPGTFSLVVETAGEPMLAAGSVRTVIRSLDRDVLIRDVESMDHLLAQSVDYPRFHATLLGMLAALGLLLATVGIYGVISYSVEHRTREIGVRLALGASFRRVLGMVVGEGLVLAAVGIVIGTLASVALTRVLRELLFGVSPTDSATYVAVVLLLGLVAMLASYIPARRATKVDPMVALRYE